MRTRKRNDIIKHYKLILKMDRVNATMGTYFCANPNLANWSIVKDEEEGMRWKRDWTKRKLRLKVKNLLWNDNLNRKLEAKVNVTGLC